LLSLDLSHPAAATLPAEAARFLLEHPELRESVVSMLHAADLGTYADADWHITEYVKLRGGLRADVLYFNVDDRLGNFIPR
jgi:hypothetical protein